MLPLGLLMLVDTNYCEQDNKWPRDDLTDFRQVICLFYAFFCVTIYQILLN